MYAATIHAFIDELSRFKDGLHGKLDCASNNYYCNKKIQLLAMGPLEDPNLKNGHSVDTCIDGFTEFASHFLSGTAFTNNYIAGQESLLQWYARRLN